MKAYKKKADVVAVLCALIRGDESFLDWPRLPPNDWQEIRRQAELEGVAPLIWHTIEQLDWPEFDPPLVDRLAQDYFSAAARSALQFDELSRILAAWEDAGIRGLILKGAALALTIYPDPALRPMGDLDFLVRREAFQDALQTLEDLGYERTGRPIKSRLDPLLDREYFLLGGPAQRVGVDLHWNLIAGDADLRTPPLDWFWAQSNPLPFPLEASPTRGFHHRQLSPGASLLYASAHTMLQHGSSARLIWKVDIQRLLTIYEQQFDWPELLDQARRLRWEPALAAALAWAQANLDAALPDGILDALGKNTDLVTSWVVDSLNSPIPSRSRRRLSQLATLTWKARLGLFLRLLFPPRSYLTLSYDPQPAWAWPLYYPYRWWDILKDAAASSLMSYELRKNKKEQLEIRTPK